jgi:hypothetical protein
MGKSGGTQQAAAAASGPGGRIDSTRAIADRGPLGSIDPRHGGANAGAVADRGPLGSAEPRRPDDPNRTTVA